MNNIEIDKNRTLWVSDLVTGLNEVLQTHTFGSNQSLYVRELIDQLKLREELTITPPSFYKAMLVAWREGGVTFSDDISVFFPILLGALSSRRPDRRKFFNEVFKFFESSFSGDYGNAN